ncbi:MAG: UDP-N-acetylglucosamine 2-epimerase (non-hydrolyzing) [Candidatus Baltobacteraceae bacterium]
MTGKPLRVMTVFGTRPDTIKMAPVVQALSTSGSQIESIVCVTAQHREMLDDLLSFFEIEPNYDLDIMTQNQTLTQITSRVLEGMESVLKKAKPDVVLVHGDTTTSTSAALAAFYAHIPVGHVEAGLRTSDLWSPYPEEMNRRVTGTIAAYHFAPTELAKQHLLRENVGADEIVVTGNTVIDEFLATAGRSDLPFPSGWESLDRSRPIIAVTAHRRENHPYMAEMARAMRAITELPMRPQIILPVHPSPQVKPIIHEILGSAGGVLLTEPLDYPEMVSVIAQCSFVLTDSGGLQEEAPCLGKPVLVMRDETERPEGLEAGTLQLVGHDPDRILAAAARLLSDPSAYERMAKAHNPYGDGLASGRIVAWLLARLRGGIYPAPFSADSRAA